MEAKVDDLIIRVLSGHGSDFEKERLKRWREESPDHEDRYQEAARVWALTAPDRRRQISPMPHLETLLARAATLETVDAAQEAGASGEARKPAPPMALAERKGRFRLRHGGWVLLAAAVAALSLFGRFGEDALAPVASHEAPPGQVTTVNLRDGSFARLAGGAHLEEWEEEGRRVVSLEGRAFFAVSHDEARPFEVRSGARRVEVLGTRFELQAEPELFRTIVVEGSVSLENPEGSVRLTAGQVGVSSPGQPPTVTIPEDVFDLLDWPDGTMVFQGTPLQLVATEVSRFFGRPLVVEDGSMATRRITAWFQGESFDEVAEALCQSAGAVCREEDGGVTMGFPDGEGVLP